MRGNETHENGIKETGLEDAEVEETGDDRSDGEIGHFVGAIPSRECGGPRYKSGANR